MLSEDIKKVIFECSTDYPYFYLDDILGNCQLDSWKDNDGEPRSFRDIMIILANSINWYSDEDFEDLLEELETNKYIVISDLDEDLRNEIYDEWMGTSDISSETFYDILCSAIEKDNKEEVFSCGSEDILYLD